MTSLARQLQALAPPDKQISSKKRASLLFEPAEAADLNVATVHSIGLNGLEQLISIDKRFDEFETVLFHESFKDFERTVEARDVLEDLDNKLELFLRRLSPYFLLKPTQKCLEWLIRVFKIHRYNVDALMECVLPYYETKLFARVIQLLSLKDHTSKWNWLRPVKKSGSPLSPLTLTQHCLTELPFLVFICEMVASSLRSNHHSPNSSRVVLSLYTSTVLTVLECAKPVTEEITLRLVPYIEMGLKSKNNDYRASTYMIVSQLSVLVRMDEKLSKSMMELLSKSLFDTLIKEGLCCLAVLTQTQELDTLSKKTLHHLHRAPSLVRTLASISSVHSITSLLNALLCSLLDEHLSGLRSTTEDGSSDTHKSVLQEILDEVILEDKVAHRLVRKLLDGVIDLCEEKEKIHKLLTRELGSLVQRLDSKYPVVMDEALEDTIASLCTNKTDKTKNIHEVTNDNGALDSAHTLQVDNRVQYLHDFVSSSLPQSRHEVLVDVGSTLVLSVHHPNPSVRAAAIGHLGETLKSRTKDMMSSDLDSDFISSSLLTRLGDEDPAVITAVLELGPKVLFKRLSPLDLVRSLTLIISRKKLHRASDEWQTCALKSLSILMSKSLLERAPQAVDDVIVSGIPLLFLGRNGNEFGGRVLEVMEGSGLAKTHVALKGLGSVSRDEVWQRGCDGGNHRNDKVLASANAALFSHIGHQIGKMDSDGLKTLLSRLVSAACSAPIDQHHYITLVVVAMAALAVVTDTTIQHVESLHLLTHINQHLSILVEGVAKERRVPSHDLAAVFSPLMEKHSDKCLSHKLLLLWALGGLCQHLIVPEDLSASMWLNVIQTSSVEQLYYHSLLSLFAILTELVDLQLEGKGQGVTAPSKLMLHTVMQCHFSKRGTLLRFLAMIWTLPLTMELESLPASRISPVLQARSLSIACAFLQCLKDEMAIALTNNHCPVIPSLLIPLASSHKLIRERALDCLVALQNACSPLHPIPDPTSPEKTQNTTTTSVPPILHLVHEITKHRLQISLDSTQIKYVLEKLHRESSSSTSFLLPPSLPCTPSRRKSRRVAKSKGLSEDGLSSLVGGVGWLECIVTHVVSLGMPVYIQSHLLQVVDKVDHVSKLSPLLPLVGIIMDGKMEHTGSSNSSRDISKHNGLILQLFVECLTPTVAASLGDHPNVFQTLTNLMMEEDIPGSYVGPSPQMLVLKQITPEFFKSLTNQELQKSILGSMIDILLNTKHSEVTAFIKETVQKLCLSAELVALELNRDVKKLGGELVLATPSKKKRAKLAVTNGEDPSSDEVGVVSVPWKRATLVLELIERVCSLVSENYQLVPLLFGLLSKCLELDEVVRFEMEYTQQLILSCLINILDHIVTTNEVETKDVLSESQFNVETVVQCIRLSSNPQTHHHALIFLSSAAGIFPGLVLHNIMPIFTFMGANILRQDDLYSFQVITQTIDTVIPPLIKSGSEIPSAITRSSTTKRRTTGQEYRATSTSVEGVITEIIHIFVDAVPHIPDHRKVPLFAHLLETVGEKDYLHVVMGLLVEKQAIQNSSVKGSEVGGGREGGGGGGGDKGDNSAKMDAGFILSVAQQFHPNVQIIAAFKLAEYLAQLPEEKPASAFKVRQLSVSLCSLFNIAGHTDKQLQHFKSLILSLLISLLSHRDFVAKVLSLEVEEIEDDIIKLLQCVLEYTSRLNRSRNGEVKKMETLLFKSYRVIDKITLLLSFGSYLEVMCQLVGTTKSTDVQEKALKMLVAKMENQKSQFSQTYEPLLLNLTDVLLDVAGNDDSSSLISRKLALDCVKLIVMKLTSTHKNKIMKVMQRVSDLLGNPELPVVVRSSCFACLGELSLSLGPHLIPILPTIIPHILNHLGTKLPLKSRIMNLQMNALVALQCIIKTLPNFLSSFTADITLKLCHPSIAGAKDKELSKLEKEAESVREELATSVPARNILPAYHKCYETILPYGNDSVLALLSMLNETITKLSKGDGKIHEDLLVEIFFLCLEYRTSQTQDVGSLPGVKVVEERCLDAFVAFVVKLSEIQFRPIFLKLLDWAVNPSSPKVRLITFYHLADRIADKLKNLFLLFAGHLIINMVQLLDRNHTNKNDLLFFSLEDDDDDQEKELALDQSCLLLRYILQCLTKCFIYDKTGFLTKERFETILQPLVDQVTNKLGGSEVSASRINSHLTGCIASFGIAAGKELLWKPLNYQLLLKTRHKDSQVRLSVLKVLQNLYGKLGEEFIVLLPETIPYLSELMEDECVEVEQLTQVVINTIENILGESIEQYF